MPPVERPGDLDEGASFGHPRGTLAIVLLFGALFALGWLAMFLFRFMEHSPPHH